MSCAIGCVMQYVVVCGSAWQCVTVCCSAYMLQIGSDHVSRHRIGCAVCYTLLQWIVVDCSVLQCVAAYCSVLQRVAACCSVLQRVAV